MALQNGIIRIVAIEGDDYMVIKVGSASDEKVVLELPYSVASEVISSMCDTIIDNNFHEWINEPMGIKESYEKPEGDNIVPLNPDKPE